MPNSEMLELARRMERYRGDVERDTHEWNLILEALRIAAFQKEDVTMTVHAEARP